MIYLFIPLFIQLYLNRTSCFTKKKVTISIEGISESIHARKVMGGHVEGDNKGMRRRGGMVGGGGRDADANVQSSREGRTS